MSYLIYIADDDANILEILKKTLLSDHHEVEVFEDGTHLLERFQKRPCDLIISDIMMPVLSGYDLCREVRKVSQVPFIMISAKDEEIDRVLGLELGSDDYISKPFSLREISVKVRNILKRSYGQKVNDSLIRNGNLVVDLTKRLVYINDDIMQVTTKEYELLSLFLKNKNRAFSREEIIEVIYGYDYFGDTRQVDHVIKRLRKKLLENNSETQIETVWGFGYKVSDLNEH